MNDQPLWRRVASAMAGRPEAVDALIAAGFGLFSLGAFLSAEPTSSSSRQADAFGVALVLLASAALAFRRRWPFPVLVVVSAAALTTHLCGYADGGLPFAVAFALYTVATRCDRRLVVAVTVLLVVTVPIMFLATDTINDSGTVVGTLAGFVLAAVWGDRKKVRDAYDEQLELREAEKERERAESARRAIADERLRIARELHDVVAHAMSVVAVQSGVGVHVIDGNTQAAKRILETISDTSRQSMNEMRGLLGMLRDNRDVQPDELMPAPGLEHLPDLVERVTDAGVPVDMVIEGERAGVPAGVDLAAYRIAQEALTNILKHAGRARASLRVRYEATAVHLEIVDDGRGAASVAARPPGNGTGHGLVGMRERAALYDGRLDAGPRPGGGYRVAATLRFTPAPAP